MGVQGPWVSAIGLGCMNLSSYYDASDEAESRRVMDTAIELGVTFFDTSDYYAHGINEELVGSCLRGKDVVIATKFGLVKGGGVDGSPANVRRSVEASLRRLGVDRIDLLYAHRVDPDIPVEETVGAMAELVSEGRVGYLGLSEVSASTLRRAHAVHPVAALQSEWSLWTRDLEADVVPVARELGVALVPYSPLGRGFLAGSVTKESSFGENDFRGTLPRFTPENLAANEALGAKLGEFARARACTPGQVALAWLLAQGPDIVPIPGTRRVHYLEENVGASQVTLSDADLLELDALMPPHVAVGGRYHDWAGYSDTPAR